MKIKVCKTTRLDDIIHKIDSEFQYEIRSYWDPQKTCPSDYSTHFVDEDVTVEQLQEYVSKGYAIKINY